MLHVGFKVERVTFAKVGLDIIGPDDQGNFFAGLWYTIGWLIVGIVVTGLFYRERPLDSE